MLTGLARRFPRSGQWLSLSMLLALHLALSLGMESIWFKPLLLMHVGLFLLWQPLWRGESQLSWRSLVLIVGLGLVAHWWLNWWLLAFWVGGLFALVGGRVFGFQAKWQRYYYLLVMAYLLDILMLGITPQIFGLSAWAEKLDGVMDVSLPALLVLMVMLPKERELPGATQTVDFIYSVLLFTLLTLLVLGSLLFMSLGHLDYLDALLRTLFSIALMLFALGWLWNPRMGFGGLQSMLSHYLLNIGTPLEVWLKHLAESAQQEQSPAKFMARAARHLLDMPWVSGLSWESDEGHGILGEASEHRLEIVDQDLKMILFAKQAIPPTMVLHVHLLIQLLGNFYQAKRRERQLREMTRLQTIYETGSRLTHDLKNMLQSLFALTSVAQHSPEKAQPILRQQLPILTQRIEEVLAKLKSPVNESENPELPLSVWWGNLKERHQHQQIEWQAVGEVSSQAIPVQLFDSVADNLISNACNKRLREPGISIRVELQSTPLCLSVEDSGSAIPEGIVRQLLNTVTSSEDGLGVGLYQAARWARQNGYQLAIGVNQEGRVRFDFTINRQV